MTLARARAMWRLGGDRRAGRGSLGHTKPSAIAMNESWIASTVVRPLSSRSASTSRSASPRTYRTVHELIDYVNVAFRHLAVDQGRPGQTPEAAC
jgi:hypothetical protein